MIWIKKKGCSPRFRRRPTPRTGLPPAPARSGWPSPACPAGSRAIGSLPELRPCRSRDGRRTRRSLFLRAEGGRCRRRGRCPPGTSRGWCGPHCGPACGRRRTGSRRAGPVVPCCGRPVAASRFLLCCLIFSVFVVLVAIELRSLVSPLQLHLSRICSPVWLVNYRRSSLREMKLRQGRQVWERERIVLTAAAFLDNRQAW